MPKPTRKSTNQDSKDIYALSIKEKERLNRQGKDVKRLKEIQGVIGPLAHIKQRRGTLQGTGLRRQASEMLNVSVWTIDEWIEAYIEDPRVEAFLGKSPGRKKGRGLSEEQKAIADYFYLNPNLKTIYPSGDSHLLAQTASIPYIYDVIRKFYPEPSWSIHTLRRYFHDLRSDNPLVIDRARKGEDFIRNNFIPTMRNDVERPNERWQIDGRPLPIYVVYDGMICTVTLLQLLDDFSWYPVRHRLIPRKIRDEEGLPKGADFTSGDVGILLASAMHYNNMRPESVYTDNGSQIIAIEEFLDDLTEENETLVRMTNSIPCRPRGRGKIEKFLGLMDDLLKDLPANFVGNEKDLHAVNLAKKSKKKLTFEQLCELFDEYIDEVRKKPRNKKEKTSRTTIWQSSIPLSAPSIRRLKVLTPVRLDTHVAVNAWMIAVNGEAYEPKATNEEDFYHWALTAARKESVPLHGAKLDAGWAIEVCLTGGHWIECVLKTGKTLSIDQYIKLQNAALKRVRLEQEDLYGQARGFAENVGADQIHKHVITKQPMLLSEAEQIAPEAQAETVREEVVAREEVAASPKVPRPKHGRSPSLKSSQRKKSSPPTPPASEDLDSSDIPDLAELMRQFNSSKG